MFLNLYETGTSEGKINVCAILITLQMAPTSWLIDKLQFYIKKNENDAWTRDVTNPVGGQRVFLPPL